MFQTGMKGTLMRIEEAAETRYKYEIWFDYTRQAMTTISEGAMVAVPNFASTREERHYSILEIASLLPVHYALGNDISGYPGFVLEAAKSAGQDWVSQEKEATDETTKIRCIAIPTNIEWVQRKDATDVSRKDFQQESSIPMVGHDALPLDSQATNIVANLNIDTERDTVLEIGTLVRDETVPALLKVDELVRLHFGIFGFTGSGKSNLLSTIVSSLIAVKDHRTKIVVLDFLGEYSVLLADHLVDLPGALLINLGVESLPRSVVDYFEAPDESKRVEAAKQLARTSVAPAALANSRDGIGRAFSQILFDKKIRVLHVEPPTCADIARECRDAFTGNIAAGDLPKLEQLISEIGKGKNHPADVELVEQWLAKCSGCSVTGNAQKSLRRIKDKLEEYKATFGKKIPEGALVGMDDLKNELNDEARSSLIVVQAHDPDALRNFSLKLVNSMFGNRRLSGRIGPPVSFIFDEADEFIPLQTEKDTSHARSRAAATTLARRGRKFGLGLGIATQRITHLDVSILAQPHTYFVSKLPRHYDREKVSEAFGFTEEHFRQTFKFKKGDWLLASYDAAGLEAVPIPIHCPDANVRIINFLDRLSKKPEKQLELQAP